MDPRVKAFQTIIKEAFPELAGYHCPIRARVTAVHQSGGDMAERTPRYAVDVQPLRPDWSDDTEKPVIPDVELAVIWAGPDRGVYCLPEVGAIVRVGWYYGDPAHPYVDAILGYGYSCPDHAVGKFIIQHSSGIRLEIGPEKIIIDGPSIELAGGGHPIAQADVAAQLYGDHTHVCPHGGSTGPPSNSLAGCASEKSFTG